MAGHSQFANIKHRKEKQDAKRSKIFTKLIREIITAAKLGLPDPDANSRLRAAILAARAENLPKDRIDAALKKASSSNDGDNYEEIRYEGYAPFGVALIIEALTDNRNRTASDIRSAFTKHGGSLGETGSVSFMFDRVGIIEYPKLVANENKILELSLDAGASDCESFVDKYIIYSEPDIFNKVRDILSEELGNPSIARLSWKAKDSINIKDKEHAEKLMKLIDVLEDSDDVQDVYGNFVIEEDILNRLDI